MGRRLMGRSGAPDDRSEEPKMQLQLGFLGMPQGCYMAKTSGQTRTVVCGTFWRGHTCN